MSGEVTVNVRKTEAPGANNCVNEVGLCENPVGSVGTTLKLLLVHPLESLFFRVKPYVMVWPAGTKPEPLTVSVGLARVQEVGVAERTVVTVLMDWNWVSELLCWARNVMV